MIITILLCLFGIVISASPDCTRPITFYEPLDSSNEEFDLIEESPDLQIAPLNDVILINDYCLTEVLEEEERRAEKFLLEKEIEKLQAKIRIHDLIEFINNYIHPSFTLESSRSGCDALCGLSKEEFTAQFANLIEERAKIIELRCHYNLAQISARDLSEISDGFDPLVSHRGYSIPCPVCSLMFGRRVFTTARKNIREKYLKPAYLNLVAAKNKLAEIRRKIEDFRTVLQLSRDRLEKIFLSKNSPTV